MIETGGCSLNGGGSWKLARLAWSNDKLQTNSPQVGPISGSDASRVTVQPHDGWLCPLQSVSIRGPKRISNNEQGMMNVEGQTFVYQPFHGVQSIENIPSTLFPSSFDIRCSTILRFSSALVDCGSRATDSVLASGKVLPIRLGLTQLHQIGSGVLDHRQTEQRVCPRVRDADRQYVADLPSISVEDDDAIAMRATDQLKNGALSSLFDRSLARPFHQYIYHLTNKA